MSNNYKFGIVFIGNKSDPKFFKLVELENIPSPLAYKGFSRLAELMNVSKVTLIEAPVEKLEIIPYYIQHGYIINLHLPN